MKSGQCTIKWNGRDFRANEINSHKPHQSLAEILTEINPEYSLEGLMLKLEPQYFGHLV